MCANPNRRTNINKINFPVIKNRRFSYESINVKIELQFEGKFSLVLRVQKIKNDLINSLIDFIILLRETIVLGV